PLALAQRENTMVEGFIGSDLKTLVEGLVGGQHGQVLVQQQHRLVQRVDQRVGKGAALADLLGTDFDQVNVHDRDGRSVNLVFGRFVGTNAHRPPVAAAILNLHFLDRQVINDLRHHLREVGQAERQVDVGDGAADVAGD